MPTNEYHFITRWRVEGTPEEVFSIIDHAEDLVSWWPAVYLDVKVLEPGDTQGVGKVVSLLTKGWLPYTLRWKFRTTEKRFPNHLALEAWGDFRGRGMWTFTADGPWVDITYDWKVRADKRLVRFLSFLLKPIFSANHRWAMAKGEESLRLELARRRAQTPEERAAVPAPPPPTTTSPLPLLLALTGCVAVLGGLAYLVFRLAAPR
jgi:hypothetical protein